MKNLSIQDLEDFLSENQEQLYYQGNTYNCPIARYLQARLEDGSVHAGSYYAYDSEDSMLLNYADEYDWMGEFIKEFDRIPSEGYFFSLSGEEILNWMRKWKMERC